MTAWRHLRKPWDVVRAEAFVAGLVDVKVCAIDATWSGLKLVRRLRDRAAKTP